MSWGLPWGTPYYLGAGASIEDLAKWPVTLDGFPYLLDTRETPLRHASVPLLRGSFDDRNDPGRQTLNPEAFWGRTFESWHVGAGQSHFDRTEDSNPYRFRRSKNINIWDRWQISLLPSTDPKALFDDVNVFLVVAGDFLYVSDGNELKRAADITPDTATLTTITGTPAGDITALASDGFNVLSAHGANGIYRTTRGAATSASQITGTVTQVAHGKGRWIAAEGPSLYDITTLVGGGAVALPGALFTHPNTDWDWVAFAEGPSAFYAGGVSGDKSLIYRLTMKEDGTGLNQPVVAGFLPDGEILHSLYGYLGFVLLGTSKGVRVGVVGGNGDLTIGAFIPTDEPVKCFEGQESFVWFGWSDFEGTDSGLGRLSLETFSDTDALAPAYASDLMTGTAGATVTSVVTFQDRRVFGIASGAAGLIYAEEPDVLAATGEIDTGLFDYGLTDHKLSLFVDMSHVSHEGGSHSTYLSVDRSAFGLLATHTEEHDPIGTGEARGHEFELRVELNRSGDDEAMGPIMRSWSLRSQPAAKVTQIITAPLLLAPVVTTLDGEDEAVNVAEAAEHIASLCDEKRVVLWREGERAWSVIVTDFELAAFDTWGGALADQAFNGTVLVQMKVVN